MNKVSPQAIKLHQALLNRGIKCQLEYFDGYKHIDITIPWAKIDIEVNGLQHYTNPNQIMSDFQRSYWSITRDDYDTFHVPNLVVDQCLDSVADALAVVARAHYRDIQDDLKHPIIAYFRLLLRKIRG